MSPSLQWEAHILEYIPDIFRRAISYSEIKGRVRNERPKLLTDQILRLDLLHSQTSLPALLEQCLLVQTLNILKAQQPECLPSKLR